MKKLLPLLMLAFVGLFALSCESDDDRDYGQDYDTYPVMKDVSGTFSASNEYTLQQSIQLPASDVVLVYRNISSTGTVWQLIPKTEYLTLGRELDYNFIFSKDLVEIYTEANFDQATMTSTEKAQYLNNQQFRIVLVPASAAASLESKEYNSVLNALKVSAPQK
ncbi:hypothetical protein [Chryseobacterium sp. A301]